MSHTRAPGSIVQLAPELLELILSYLGPQDLTRFGQTCRLAHDFVRPTNQLLWKQTFLQLFDHPKHVWEHLVPTARAQNQPREALWDWHRELVRRIKAYNFVLKFDKETLALEIDNVVRALLDVEQTASCASVAENGSPVSLNVMYLNRLVQRAPDFDSLIHDFSRHPSSLAVPRDLKMDLDRPVTRSMLRRGSVPPEWASRFHIMYGPTEREQESTASKAAARAIVYDWGVTSEDADFGPFLKDGSGAVDWQSVEAISSLMHRIFDTALKAYHLHPTGFDMHVPNRQPINPAAPDDWAGVTGTWAGTYAFLDYRALVHYNFAHSLEHPLDLGNYEEACGDLMRFDLEANDSEELRNDERLQSDLPYCDDLPKLYFEGTSTRQATERPSIGVRGVACLAPGGREVRWRLIIRYAGADQWQLEGVQPSGIRCGGIYGLWSHVDHDDHGPMGPFYYTPCAITEFSFD
ncbi:hypothetical protein DPSP01_006285 [Paraphaeosphaeria sporulosa]|uniref:F-box domain-containing protein n=1 Tax=Paraphaeosphaeria sporulosa TaxID=1460663 RepID=A0A177CG97_9PLEO|nr:uncharacterized protein CC84DRAFT_1217086 [Paraphaeosphaeria sporulosa]OAG05770.1 hypothetical protein CC84DRAFT_1217086 [Paraphaeosphaeria sporulosa]